MLKFEVIICVQRLIILYKTIQNVIALLASLSACSTTQVKASPKAAVTAPGKALNLDKKTIPANLTNLDNPYDITGASDCASIGAQIAELTEFAGPDWDSPEHFSKSGRTSEKERL